MASDLYAVDTCADGERTFTRARRSKAIRVALVRDSPLLVAGLSRLLAPHRDEILLHTQAQGDPAPGSVDVVLFDALTAREPAQAVREVAARTGAAVVLYSWIDDQQPIDAAIVRGAAGFLSKAATAEEVIATVQGAHTYQPRAVPVSQRQPSAGAAVELTPREHEILTYIAQGLSNKEIAARCYLSINSVKTYIRTAYKKIGATNRSSAVLWAVRNGFASL